MTKNKQTLVAWLRDAHAMERASVDTLDRLADRLSRYPELAAGFREHLEQTREQAQRLERILRSLGQSTRGAEVPRDGRNCCRGSGND